MLHDLTALEQGDAVRNGDVSPLELVEHYAGRADDVGAFITTTHDLARDHARRLTATGRPTDAGPLWGVPTGIKDLHPTAGVRTTFGSAAYDDFVPEESDDLVLTVEAAGMPSLGKTSTPEFGSPCYTEPDVAPPAVTPWDTTRTAGGSSGGAAAAVAAGLLPVAPGSDGGGSIRIPASCCGLVGLKPSRGRISGAPRYGDPVGLATPGTLARTVRDAAALLDVLAGRRVGDPFWAPPPSAPFLEACDREPGRLRVARFVAPVIADVDVHPSSVDRLGGRVAPARAARPRRRGRAGADPARGGRRLRDLLGRPHRAVARTARPRGPAPAPDPLARRARARRQRTRVRPRHREPAPARRPCPRRAGGVRRRPHAHPRPTAGAGRRAPRRRRPGPRLREPEGLHALDVRLERHRHARRLAAAPLDRRRPAGRRHARRATGRGGAAALARRAGGERRRHGWTGVRRGW